MQAKIYNTPAVYSLLDVLAVRLLKENASRPLALAEVNIILPTRRACRSLKEAFIRHSEGNTLLLPKMMSVSNLEDTSFFDDEEVPKAISDVERKLILARLIMAKPDVYGVETPTPEKAMLLADSLCQFLDEVYKEEIDFTSLEGLVPENLAEHWQEVLRFLEIIRSELPKILAERGVINPSERMVRLLRKKARVWQETPPDYQVIAVGITGSLPSTAELLKVIANLPKGMVILSSLDTEMDEESWGEISPSHPQYEMKKLLEILGVDRKEILPYVLGEPLVSSARLSFAQEVLRPSTTTDKWLNLASLPEGALDNVERLTLDTPHYEALAAALIMRRTLDEEGKRAILVTTNKDLARRTAAELLRFGVVVDDSSGTPLNMTSVGVFLSLIAEAGADSLSFGKLLSLLKHPLTACGINPVDFRLMVRKFEKTARSSKENNSFLFDWQNLGIDFASFASLFTKDTEVSFLELLNAHLELAERLASSDEVLGPLRLWRGDEGMKAAELFAELAEYGGILGDINPMFYPKMLQNIMAGYTIRSKFGSHPRLEILGPIEARLQKADTVIIAGMNEGSFPRTIDADPWLSLQMRKDCGLSSMEEKIGIAALDFVNLFCSPSVVMTRSAKEDGTPTVPSRWLLRMDALLSALGEKINANVDKNDLEKIVKIIDVPKVIQSIAPPAPCPPIFARPREISATNVENWKRDPYIIYAKYILKLFPLKDIDAKSESKDYGSVVHTIFQSFIDLYEQDVPDDALDKLLDIASREFAKANFSGASFAFWWPRFVRTAEWFIEKQKEKAPAIQKIFSELEGAFSFPSKAGDFMLKAKADRLDLLKDGSLDVIDYKTGAPRSQKEVASGYAPQLPLEALIAKKGGFKALPSDIKINSLEYWKISGSSSGSGIYSAVADDKNPEDIVNQAFEGLQRLVSDFDNERVPYLATPRSDKAPKYSDYEHLERVKEWSVEEDNEDTE